MRDATLGYLNALFSQIESLRGWVAFYQEMAAREIWTLKKLIPLADDQEAYQQVMIERQVNTMDPDFNFSKEIFGQETVPKKPLCISATP